jgi:diguanylate cyclase (GGDEF)-like protein
MLKRIAYAEKVMLSEEELIYNAVVNSTDKNATKQVLVEANQVLHRLAHIDGLTGLSNRRAFDFVLAQEWQKASKFQQPIALIMIDVDCFKAFNDCYGHRAGDECLQKVAQVLRLEVRRMSDIVARYGGEEFALILPNTSLHDAIKIARNLRQSVADLRISHKNSTVADMVTISCGVACIWPSHGYSVDDLLHLADQALYKAKHSGRNTVEG